MKKTYFTKCFLLVPRVSKLIFKTENGMIKTGYGIFSPTSMPRIKKKHLTKCFLICSKGFKLIFKTGYEIIQTGNGIISLTTRPPIKKFL